MVKYLINKNFFGNGIDYRKGDLLTQEEIQGWRNLFSLINTGYLVKIIENSDAEKTIEGTEAEITSSEKKKAKVRDANVDIYKIIEILRETELHQVYKRNLQRKLGCSEFDLSHVLEKLLLAGTISILKVGEHGKNLIVMDPKLV